MLQFIADGGFFMIPINLAGLFVLFLGLEQVMGEVVIPGGRLRGEAVGDGVTDPTDLVFPNALGAGIPHHLEGLRRCP